MELADIWRAVPIPGVLVRAEGDDLVVEALNEAARRLGGDVAKSFVGITLRALYPDLDEVPEIVGRALETGELQSRTIAHPMRSAVGTLEIELRAVPVADDAAVLFLAPAALTQFRPTAPSVDELQDEVAATWLDEGNAAAYVWRVEPDGDFTLVSFNQRAVEVTDGGVLKVRGLRARSLYFDQPEFLGFLETVRDEGRAEMVVPLRSVTEPTQKVRFFRSLGVRRDGHVFVFAEDCTEEHTMAGNLATAEKRLRRAQRLDSLGRLAGGIAHDFNNLLAAIVGLGELIRLRVDGDVANDVETLLATADRGAALTQRLLSFARREEVTPIPFSVGSLLAGLRPMLDRLIGPTVDLELDIESVPSAFMDPAQLEQIIVNLVVNAQEAMPEGGVITLRLRKATADDRSAFGDFDGDFLLLEVEDEGVGIPSSLQDLVFEPFVSSKDEGSGGGLGLATVKSLLTGAGGSVRLSSEEGHGSTFHLLLPSTDAAPEPVRSSGDAPAPGPTRARLLLVEDDPLLRRVLHRSLSRDGFEVLTARDGREALEQLEGNPDLEIDALVTDVVMPHVSGPELARTLRKRRPNLPVVFCSGHHTETLADEISPPVAALAKPMSHEVLQKTILDLMGEAESLR